MSFKTTKPIFSAAFIAVLMLGACGNDEEINRTNPLPINQEEQAAAREKKLRNTCETLKHNPDVFLDKNVAKVMRRRCEAQLGMTFKTPR